MMCVSVDVSGHVKARQMPTLRILARSMSCMLACVAILEGGSGLEEVTEDLTVETGDLASLGEREPAATWVDRPSLFGKCGLTMAHREKSCSRRGTTPCRWLYSAGYLQPRGRAGHQC